MECVRDHQQITILKTHASLLRMLCVYHFISLNGYILIFQVLICKSIAAKNTNANALLDRPPKE